ncbi:MAG TPA: hypothetical protein VGN19_12765 [Pedococcus sp.]|nr:hypothetical protein [Pedococcus sp.]
MSTQSSLARLPHLVVVETSSRCGCGDTIDSGERAGEADDRGRLRCLRCMAALQSQAQTAVGHRPVVPGTPAGTGAEHAARVSEQAELLVNRMAAARALGTLVHQLRPLSLSDR